MLSFTGPTCGYCGNNFGSDEEFEFLPSDSIVIILKVQGCPGSTAASTKPLARRSWAAWGPMQELVGEEIHRRHATSKGGHRRDAHLPQPSWLSPPNAPMPCCRHSMPFLPRSPKIARCTDTARSRSSKQRG